MFHFHKWQKDEKWTREDNFLFYNHYRHCTRCGQWQRHIIYPYVEYWENCLGPVGEEDPLKYADDCKGEQIQDERE